MPIICYSVVNVLAVRLLSLSKSWKQVRWQMRQCCLSHSRSLPLTYSNPYSPSHTHTHKSSLTFVLLLTLYPPLSVISHSLHIFLKFPFFLHIISHLFFTSSIVISFISLCFPTDQIWVAEINTLLFVCSPLVLFCQTPFQPAWFWLAYPPVFCVCVHSCFISIPFFISSNLSIHHDFILFWSMCIFWEINFLLVECLLGAHSLPPLSIFSSLLSAHLSLLTIWTPCSSRSPLFFVYLLIPVSESWGQSEYVCIHKKKMMSSFSAPVGKTGIITPHSYCGLRDGVSHTCTEMKIKGVLPQFLTSKVFSCDLRGITLKLGFMTDSRVMVFLCCHS